MAEGGVIPGGRQSARGGLVARGTRERGGEFDICARSVYEVCSTRGLTGPALRQARLAMARPPPGRGVAEGKNLRLLHLRRDAKINAV